MAVQHGYGKIAGANSLVFAYDTGDTRNSFKGEPTTNEFTTAFRDGASGLTGAGTLQPGVVGPFGRTTDPVFRKTNGKIRFGTIDSDIGTLYYGNTYTFSVYLRKVPGTTAPTGNEFDICDRKTATSWVGNWSDSLTYDWQRYWVTALHDTTSSYHFIDIGTYNTEEAFEWTCPQIELGTHPTQYVPYGTNHQTRSATEGLLDLTGNETIDLSRVGFDSNADLDFDGTDDEIQIISSNWAQPGEDITVEAMVYREGPAQNTRQYSSIINASDDIYGVYSFSLFVMPTTNILVGWVHSGEHQNNFDSGYVIEYNTWYHVAFTLVNGDTHTVKTYVNGVERSSATMGEGVRFANITKTTIGARVDRNQFEWNGKIPVVKIYNQALTAAEVQTNFNNYKTRFNIA